MVENIRALKGLSGKDIVQYGLGQVSFALLEQGLVDEILLWIHPIIPGEEVVHNLPISSTVRRHSSIW